MLTLVEAPQVPDRAAREAALDIDVSCIVEAPAGSGKTGLLIQRYLKLLATVEHPGEVLALTFTRKATGEMRERVLQALREAAAQAPAKQSEFQQLTRALAENVLRHDGELGWHLLGRSHLLNIRTIDALCGEIARATPLLSGSAAAAQPVDDPEPLYRRAAQAVMLRLGGNDAMVNQAIETVLLHRDGNLQDCQRILAEMLGTREQWGRLVPLGAALLDDSTLDETVLPRLEVSLQRARSAALKRLRGCFPPAMLARIVTVAQELSFADPHKDLPNVFRPCAQWSDGPGDEAHHVDEWAVLAHLLLTKDGALRRRFQNQDLKVAVGKELREELLTIVPCLGDVENLQRLLHDVRSLPPAEYPTDQWRVAKALFRLLQLALVELKLLFARDGVCDFNEVALAARTALQSGDVQVAMGTRLRHLLIDEMQDSSSSQYELLRDITQGWDGSEQTLFLVGDPKQSIYLFRQARVELFQQSMAEARLGDVPLRVLRLSANFRSGRGIVQQFNDAFQQVFPPPDRAMEGDVAFSSAIAVLQASPQDDICWHGSLITPASDATVRVRQRQAALHAEAAAMADIVQQQRETRPDVRIAILARARSHVAEIAKVLTSRAIPYRAVDMDALDERREVLDVLAITRALLHPADRTAWLAILRAPWCGIGMADLHRLAAGDQRDLQKEAPRLAMRTRANDLSVGPRERVLRTLNVMDAALLHSGAEPLGQRVERTWRSLGGDACVSDTALANVRQFLRVLDAMDEAGELVTPHTLQPRLSRLYAEPNSAPDAVDIMTIHKAKGLEWDIVLVPGLHRSGGQDGVRALNWLELPSSDQDGDPDVLLAPLPGKGRTADGLYAFVRAVRTQRTQAELKRLFYVAATRTRTTLHLFASPDADREGKPKVSYGTLLRAAGGAVPPFDTATANVEGTLPSPADFDSADDPPIALAAAAEPVMEGAPRGVPILERLVSSYDPLAQMRSASLSLPALSPALPIAPRRAEGTFGARAVGTAIHSFVERLARELQAQLLQLPDVEAAAHLLAGKLPTWSTAIHAALRSSGLPHGEVTRATHTVLRALTNLLETEESRWLLLPHRAAAAEAAWRTQEDTGVVRIRIDRSFYAGSKPLEPGDGTLWIVDFKTADWDGEQQDSFLAEQKKRYASQLEGYARLRARVLPAGTPIMLALSYPLIQRLIYWPYGPSALKADEGASPLSDSERSEQSRLVL